MIWGGCKNRVVVGLNLSISSLFVHVHSLCYSTSIKRSGRVPLCSQTLPRMTASCSGLPQLPGCDGSFSALPVLNERVVSMAPAQHGSGAHLPPKNAARSTPTQDRRERDRGAHNLWFVQSLKPSHVVTRRLDRSVDT